MKSLIIFFLLLLLPIHAKADQLYVLTYEQAVKAKEFLDKEEYVIEYCSCCDNSSKDYIKIESVSIEEYPRLIDGVRYYTIRVKGVDPFNNISKDVNLDLAYSFFIRSDQKAYNVAIVLDFSVDHCNVDELEVDRRIKTKKKFKEKEIYYRRF